MGIGFSGQLERDREAAIDLVRYFSCAARMMEESAHMRRGISAILLAVPFGYLGLLFATFVHEFIGHGLVAVALGGDFLGFQIDFDGMGYANAHLPENSAKWKIMSVLVGGVASTIFFGLIFLAVGLLKRKSPWLAIPAIAFAGNFLLEGGPYLFWNAIHPVPPGDIGRVISITDDQWIRVICIVAGGLITASTIWIVTYFIVWEIESWVLEGRRLTSWQQPVVLLLLGSALGTIWFVFDWDQLAPGIGAIPNFVALALHVLAAASLIAFRFAPVPLQSQTRATTISTFAGWGMMAAAILITGIWLRRGLYWS